MRNAGAGKASAPAQRINRIMQNVTIFAWPRMFVWGCRPKPHHSLRSLVATRCFKSLGFRYAPVVFFACYAKHLF